MNPQHIPARVFLDSSILQTLQDYGEYIYDGAEIDDNDRIWSIPGGMENVDALRKIILVGGRSSLEFAVSSNSLREVADRKRYDYLQWALEMMQYWQGCLSAYEAGIEPLSGRGKALAARLDGTQFCYLGAKDAKLVRDAVLLECDVFLTMERKLPKNAAHLKRELGIEVLQPISYWRLLSPWIPLLY